MQRRGQGVDVEGLLVPVGDAEAAADVPDPRLDLGERRHGTQRARHRRVGADIEHLRSRVGLEPIEPHARQRHRATRQFRCIRERRTELRDCLARGDRPVRVDHDLGDHPQQDRLHDAGGAGDAVEPHELVGVVDDDPAERSPTASASSSSVLALPWSKSGGARRAGAPAREHLAAGGAQQVEPLLERDAEAPPRTSSP